MEQPEQNKKPLERMAVDDEYFVLTPEETKAVKKMREEDPNWWREQA